MAEISIDIPIGGSFSTTPATLGNKHDIIQLNLNRFVAYVHQESQPLGYVCIFDFTDFINSNSVSVIKQELLYYDDTLAASMWLIAPDRVLLVRGRQASILNFTANDISLELVEDNFFLRGAENISSTVIPAYAQGFSAFNIKENELLVLENESVLPAASTVAEYKLWRVVYDPVLNTLSKTLAMDFTDTVNPLITDVALNTLRGGFNAEITEIPSSGDFYFNLSIVLTSLSTSSTPTLVFSARIDDTGTILEQYIIPTTSFTPRNSAALTNDFVVYHQTAGTAMKVWNGTAFVDILQLGFSADGASVNIDAILPLDQRHYFIRYATTSFRVIKVLSDQLFENNSFFVNFTNGFQTKKRAIQKYDNELYVAYGPVSTVVLSTPSGNQNFIRFRVYRIYQSLA